MYVCNDAHRNDYKSHVEKNSNTQHVIRHASPTVRLSVLPFFPLPRAPYIPTVSIGRHHVMLITPEYIAIPSPPPPHCPVGCVEARTPLLASHVRRLAWCSENRGRSLPHWTSAATSCRSVRACVCVYVYVCVCDCMCVSVCVLFQACRLG